MELGFTARMQLVTNLELLQVGLCHLLLKPFIFNSILGIFFSLCLLVSLENKTAQSGNVLMEILLAESLADLQEVKPRKIGSHYLPNASKCVA